MGRSGSRLLRRLENPPRASSLPAADLRGFAPEVVVFAVRAWTLKAEEELRSAAVFTAIVAGLLEGGAPLDLLDALGAIVRDEIAHAALCCDLAERFHAPRPSGSAIGARPRLTQSADRRRMALALLLFEGAIGESLSAMLFHAGRRGATEPCARAALDSILRDESRHASVCWAGLEVLLPALDGGDRAWLQHDLQRSFGALERDGILPTLRRLEAGDAVDPAAFALGVIPPELRVDTFYKGLERVVLPRLSRLGFDGKAAWERRYQAAPRT